MLSARTDSREPFRLSENQALTRVHFLLFEKLLARLERLKSFVIDPKLCEDLIVLVNDYREAIKPHECQPHSRDRRDLTKLAQGIVEGLESCISRLQEAQTNGKFFQSDHKLHNIDIIRAHHLQKCLNAMRKPLQIQFLIADSTESTVAVGAGAARLLQGASRAAEKGVAGGAVESKLSESEVGADMTASPHLITEKYPQLAPVYALDELLSWWDLGKLDAQLIENNIQKLLKVTSRKLAVDAECIDAESEDYQGGVEEAKADTSLCPIYCLEDLYDLTPDSLGTFYTTHISTSLDRLEGGAFCDRVFNPDRTLLTLCPSLDRFSEHTDYQTYRLCKEDDSLHALQTRLPTTKEVAEGKPLTNEQMDALRDLLRNENVLAHAAAPYQLVREVLCGTDTELAPTFNAYHQLVTKKLLPHIHLRTPYAHHATVSALGSYQQACSGYEAPLQDELSLLLEATGYKLHIEMNHNDPEKHVPISLRNEIAVPINEPSGSDEKQAYYSIIPAFLSSGGVCIKVPFKKYRNKTFQENLGEIIQELKKANNPQVATRLRRQVLDIISFINAEETPRQVKCQFKQQLEHLQGQAAEMWVKEVHAFYQDMTKAIIGNEIHPLWTACAIATELKENFPGDELVYDYRDFMPKSKAEEKPQAQRLQLIGDLVVLKSFINKQLDHLKPKATKNHSEATRKFRLYEQLNAELSSIANHVAEVSPEVSLLEIKRVIFKLGIISHHRRHGVWDKLTLRQLISDHKSWQDFKKLELSPMAEQFKSSMLTSDRKSWHALYTQEVGFKEDGAPKKPIATAFARYGHYHSYLSHQKQQYVGTRSNPFDQAPNAAGG